MGKKIAQHDLELVVLSQEFFGEDDGCCPQETGEDSHGGRENLSESKVKTIDHKHSDDRKAEGEILDPGNFFVKENDAEQVTTNGEGGIKKESGGTYSQMFKSQEVGRLIDATGKGNRDKPFPVFLLNCLDESKTPVENENDDKEEEAAGPCLRKLTKFSHHEARPDAVGTKEKGRD